MVDTSVVIGEVSLRQVRVRLESCDIPYQSVLSSHCRPGYSDNTQDTGEFFTNRTWYYGDSYLTRSEEIRGTHGSYGGGGYQIKLPHKRYMYFVDKSYLKCTQESAFLSDPEVHEFCAHFHNNTVFSTICPYI